MSCIGIVPKDKHTRILERYVFMKGPGLMVKPLDQDLRVYAQQDDQACRYDQ